MKVSHVAMPGQVLEMIDNPHYLYRMTVLRAISLLAPAMGPEITCSKLLPVVISASNDRYFAFSNPVQLNITWKDLHYLWLLLGFTTLELNFIRKLAFRVPNVKFNVAKVLQSLIPIVDHSVSDFFCFFKILTIRLRLD